MPTTWSGCEGLCDWIFSVVVMRCPPIVRGYSRPNIRLDLRKRLFHGLAVIWLGEINKRLIVEFSAVQINGGIARAGGRRGCHSHTSMLCCKRLIAFYFSSGSTSAQGGSDWHDWQDCL